MPTSKKVDGRMKGLEIVFLAVGAVLGATIRYKMVESPLMLNVIPVNVLIVNVVGSFILGMVVLFSQQLHFDTKFSLMAAVGFCGSLTTMSSFAFDSNNLLEHRYYGSMFVNIIANVGLSIGALIAGKNIASVIVGSS